MSAPDDIIVALFGVKTLKEFFVDKMGNNRDPCTTRLWLTFVIKKAFFGYYSNKSYVLTVKSISKQTSDAMLVSSHVLNINTITLAVF